MTDAIFAHPARVLYQQTPEDAARWLEIVTGRRASDATVFESRPPFFWPTEISSRRVDSYFTRMMVSTLRNFAQGANDGVSFQNSHRWMELPLGQSVEGLFVEDAGMARTLAVFYTLPDLNVNGVNTSQFIDGLRAGIIQDVSVGFYGGRFMCSICGRDMLRDMECRHWPGLEYEVKEGDTTRKVIAIADVEDALLSEVSAVYDGATPGAGVLKAQRELDAGRLDRRQVDLLEQRYRVRLVGPRTFGGVTLADETDVTQAETRVALRRAADDAQAIDGARAILRRMGAGGDSLLEDMEWAAETMQELRLLAEDGLQYRQALVDETLAEGVRAMGTQFNVDLYRGLLVNATIPQLRRMRDDWRVMGDNQFAGGPVVRASNEPPKPAPAQPAAANLAYT
jgi:hypothetical protein